MGESAPKTPDYAPTLPWAAEWSYRLLTLVLLIVIITAGFIGRDDISHFAGLAFILAILIKGLALRLMA